MLASNPSHSSTVGALSGSVQKPATFRHELIEFIADELPHWRGRSERPQATSETVLTSQLCAHLNSVTRHSPGWDVLQFRVEEPDETQPGRRIDLVASPSGTEIIIEGRRHIDFDSIMPIECKRLPTPPGAGRDEQEYVFHRMGSTGGIQRFKAGHHGAAHDFGAMIGYVQEETTAVWEERVSAWIGGLIGVQAGWTQQDALRRERLDPAARLAVLSSTHARASGLADIHLRHLWVEMA
jgi:hypothetical protein